MSNVAGLKMEKVAGVFLLQFLLTRIREEEDLAVSVMFLVIWREVDECLLK